MPLIGAADVSLRGLRSPEGDEQKAFWSSPGHMVAQTVELNAHSGEIQLVKAGNIAPESLSSTRFQLGMTKTGIFILRFDTRYGWL